MIGMQFTVSFHSLEKVRTWLDNERKWCYSVGRKPKTEVLVCFFHLLCKQILRSHTDTQVRKQVKEPEVFKDSFKHAKVRGWHIWCDSQNLIITLTHTSTKYVNVSDPISHTHTYTLIGNMRFFSRTFFIHVFYKITCSN
jgi:hypothetical protein